MTDDKLYYAVGAFPSRKNPGIFRVTNGNEWEAVAYFKSKDAADRFCEEVLGYPHTATLHKDKT